MTMRHRSPATPTLFLDLKLVCAWCSALIRDGVEPISHGICKPCAATAFPGHGLRKEPA